MRKVKLRLRLEVVRFVLNPAMGHDKSRGMAPATGCDRCEVRS